MKKPQKKANTSQAVRQQRTAPIHSFEFWPTPLWCTRALFYMLEKHSVIDGSIKILDPACGQGHMTRVFHEHSDDVTAYDIQDLGYEETGDYLFPNDWSGTDWSIFNPPFNLAEQFILKALDNSRLGVAVFARSALAESSGRYNRLFRDNPPQYIFQFSERCNLVPGQLDEHASVPTAYSWFVWDQLANSASTKFDWIPPIRKKLTKLGDWD